ncbi:MAG: NAD(P)H-hydrate dehydratase [Phycisphaerales bacterium]
MKVIKNVPKLKERLPQAHKGDFGKICIIAGSLGFSGAAVLAGKSALRSGSGLVRIAVPAGILPIIASLEPCYTTIPLAQDLDGKISAKAVDTILNAISENDCLAFGPGVGVSGGIKTILEALLRIEGLRLMIDADGLNNLSMLKDWPKINKANLILTPHPGEMKRLWQSLIRTEMTQDRQQTASDFAKETNTTIVLKGHETIVADCEKIYINTTGNPGMATAGSGDVLTGTITSLCGQGLNNFDAAVLGVYIHGLAGDLAAAEKGQTSLIATDIIDFLPAAFKTSGV